VFSYVFHFLAAANLETFGGMSKEMIEKVAQNAVFLEMFLYLCHGLPGSLFLSKDSELIINRFMIRTRGKRID